MAPLVFCQQDEGSAEKRLNDEIVVAPPPHDEGKKLRKERRTSIILDGPFRRGKWTAEEEMYAARLIEDFDAGILPNLNDGATLRAFLSKKLNCSAMRISKKFAGEKCLGKQIYLRRHDTSAEQLQAEAKYLEKLEHAFLISISTPSPTFTVPKSEYSEANTLNIVSDSSEDTDFGAGGNISSSSSENLHHQNMLYPKKRSHRRLLDKKKIKQFMHKDTGEFPFTQFDLFEEQQALQAQVSEADELLFSTTHEDNQDNEDIVDELYNAAQQPSNQSSTSFSDLPKAECIQQPPAVLMLELGPTPRNNRQAHPTIGAYAFSIARGTSNSSLQRMGCSRISLVGDARGSICVDDFDTDTDCQDLEEEIPIFFDDDDQSADGQQHSVDHQPSATKITFQPPTFVLG
mmetsp:Transcript_23428/g.30415  ORF Transcript_23428/g.30415 Transcript_23428/m.30415 type:complete len:403 (-) Transcript_23428:855-2063(-)|eukprot:CAMPEP_0197286174 /NCGR_PEP_ID=MMETSP0890-20130614/1658_1 /TAXON_ID=44058 ORGANISM="Aureoumbra lagunensis, Strain CCMP1510" /NCGR_SAMPLE_ID=MMETSP0890 /ASSEMBLY_ACC=CAM_ASM_000533 /LENGTH=402 /DNA_ID=CAMNT_0042754367 /DNA_START=183 /DNA_END=1391 /DNA_ORIENTATION=-